MRYLCVVGCVLLARAAHGQDVAPLPEIDSAHYQVAVDERRVASQLDSMGACIEVLHWAGPEGLVRSFYPSGQLKDYLPYADLAAGRLHGVATSWYEGGQLYLRQTFLQGRRDSTLLLYYPDGQLKREAHFVAGSELPGQCFDPAGLPIACVPFEQPPLYRGGQGQLTREIRHALAQHRPDPLYFLDTGYFDISFQVSAEGRIEAPQVTITNQKIQPLRYAAATKYKQSTESLMLNERTALIQHALSALAQVRPRFYPGQRDGVPVRWQYHLTVPYTYEPLPPARRPFVAAQR